MPAPGTSIQIYLGSRSSDIASAEILSALDTIEVTQTSNGPSGFQMSFLAERPNSVVSNYPIMEEPGLQTGERIIITVTIAGTAHILHDGFITHQQLVPGNGKGPDVFAVTGEDVSVQMDLYEYSLEYPMMPDAAIAALVLAKWAVLGIIPTIIPTPVSWVPPLNTPQQYGTDRCYINQLAAANGYDFVVTPGPILGTNLAYWGPPQYFDPGQNTLTVNVGPGSTVTDISFSYDALAPILNYGLIDNPLPDTPPLPLATVLSTNVPPLSTRPPLPTALPFLHTRLFAHQGMEYVQALAAAQAITNQSTDKVVTAQGSMDGLHYGGVLRAPGVVPVRGAGASFDGNYYVTSVTHKLSRTGYTQDFTLARDGTGTTISSVPAA